MSFVHKARIVVVNDETNPTFNVKPNSAQCLGLEQVRASNLINASPDEHSDTSTPASEPNQNQQMLDPRHVGAQPRASVERPFAFTFVSAFPIMVDKHKCSMPDNARPNGALKLC